MYEYIFISPSTSKYSNRCNLDTKTYKEKVLITGRTFFFFSSTLKVDEKIKWSYFLFDNLRASNSSIIVKKQ